MATFDPAPDRVNKLIRETIEEYYPDLVEAQANIGAVFAYPTAGKDGEEKGPAMVKHGRRVLARIKNNSAEDRAAGKPDATITFDARHWEDTEAWEDGERKLIALIDHELHHLIVKREKAAPGQKARVKTDDRGRPLFGMREHDWEITGFRAVVERHGKNAVEHQEARRFHDTFGNLLLDFASDKAAGRDGKFAQEVLGLTEQAVNEINADHEAIGEPPPFPNARPKGKRKPKGAAVVAAARR